jgi:hypothetical protein
MEAVAMPHAEDSFRKTVAARVSDAINGQEMKKLYDRMKKAERERGYVKAREEARRFLRGG